MKEIKDYRIPEEDIANLVQTKPNGRERMMIELLAVANANVLSFYESMEKRMAQYKNGTRDWHSFITLLQKIQMRARASMPVKDQQQLNMYAKHGKVYVVHMAGRVSEPALWRYTLTDDLKEVSKAAIEGYCSMCDKIGSEANRCPLRESMDRLCPIVDDDEAHSEICPYARLRKGEYDG